MEETQSPTTHINGDEEIGDDFYEKIEAPKFVDLTAPDRYRPDNDDRHWFCLRVGCDQKHEEEMDSEAIYKNFVLRVMAARSPNVRLHKALYREDNSKNLKCPLTVPAKSSKSRISRLAMISSISQKVIDGKPKVRALPKHSATPNAKAKQSSIVAKALTTPRNKKRLSNPDAFRSVRNPKATTIAVPKNRLVAKALVFHSPKKTVKIKTSVELKSSVKMLCSGMKKLEITSGKKHLLGYNNKPLPLDASRKQFRGREVKSRVFDSLYSQNHKGKEAKSSKCLKKKNKEKDLQQCLGPVPGEDIENDFSDMEIDEKSRNGSLEACSTSVNLKSNECSNGHEECLISEPQLHQKNVEALSEASRSDMTSLSSSEERNSSEDGNEINEGSDHEEKRKLSPEKERIPEVMESDDKENCSEASRSDMTSLSSSEERNSSKDGNEINEGSNHEEKSKSCPEKERIPEVMESDVKNALASADKANDGEVVESDVKNALASADKANDGEVVESDDKENCSEASRSDMTSLSSSEERNSSKDGNEINEGSNHEEKSKSSPEKERIPEVMDNDVENALASDDKANDGEVVESDDKENCSASDENRELKLNDSHVEKKILGRHETSKSTQKVTRLMGKPAKESSTAAAFGAQGLKYRKPKPTNPKPFRLRTDERGILKEANLEKKLHQAPLREMPGGTLNDQYQRVGISGSKTSKGEEERKSCTTPQKHKTHQKINFGTSKLEHNQANALKKSEANMKRTKSQLMKQLARPRGVMSCRKGKGMVSLLTPGQLGVIEETSTKILRPKEAAKPNDCGAFPATKASPSTTPRSLSRGRRPPTIPKEPNFHSIHVPKNCTKKLA